MRFAFILQSDGEARRPTLLCRQIVGLSSLPFWCLCSARYFKPARVPHDLLRLMIDRAAHLVVAGFTS